MEMNFRRSFMNMICRSIGMAASLMLITLLSACSGRLPQSSVIAVVDDAQLTVADLQHALTVSHRVQDTSKAGTLDIMRYVDKLIDEQLMIDEVKRMGLESDPALEAKVAELVLRESVARLHEEVIAKIVVSDEDIKKTFETGYVSLGLIEVASKEEAERLKEEYVKGADFGELAGKYSSHASKDREGSVVYKQDILPPVIVEALAGLNEREVTAPKEISGKWYLFRIETREDGLQKNFDKVKENIKKDLTKKLQKEREAGAVDRFRQKFPVSTDQQLFDSLDLEVIAGDLKTWNDDRRVLAKVKDSEILVADFVVASGVKPKKPDNDTASPIDKSDAASGAEPKKAGKDKVRSKDDILKGLINTKLIDVEALSRHYETAPDLAEQIRYFRDYEMRKLFFNIIIFPLIDISDEKMLDFYRTNQDSFKTEPLYRFQRIHLKTEAEAERILSNLKDGADFLWFAKTMLPDELSEEDINTQWLTKKELPEGLQAVIDSLNTGDLSPVLKLDKVFGIYRLKGMTDATVKSYEAVQELVRKKLIEGQQEKLVAEFTGKLRSEAKIVIYQDVVKEFEAQFSQ